MTQFAFIILSALLSVSALAANPPKKSYYFENLKGKYIAELKIGKKLFLDELEITEMTAHPGFASFAEYLGGSYSVPGIFTSPLISGKVVLEKREETKDFDGFAFSFAVLANENGKQYPVYFQFRGALENFCLVKGRAATEQEFYYGLLGEVVLRNQSENCRGR